MSDQTYDFGDGPVPAKRHINPDGSTGGWVANSAQVFGDAQVYGNARVYGDAWEKSPLQIQGTKHMVCMCTRKLLNIGCTRLTIDEWKKKGIILGEQNGYTTEQIEEYRLYIELAAKLYPPIEEEKDV